MGIITQSGPTPEQEIISHFLDQFNQNRRSRDANAIQQQQVNQQGEYQRGMLGVQQGQADHTKNLTIAKSLLDGWQRRMDEGDATVRDDAAKTISEHPELKPYLGVASMFHASQGQQATGVAQQKHLADNQSVLGGDTDPSKVNIYTNDVAGKFQTPENFKFTEAQDLDKQPVKPDLASAIPAPSKSAVANLEARDTGGMTTGANNLTSQTQITDANIREAGATKRQGMSDAAAMNRTKYEVDAKVAALGAKGEVGTDYKAERQGRILDSVNDLFGRVSPMTVGLGALMSGINATPAKDFAADLEKLKANIAFNELTEMRAASKTGGALGAVSNEEGKRLESALGALDQKQSVGNMRKNLLTIRQSIEKWESAKAKNGGGADGGEMSPGEAWAQSWMDKNKKKP